MEKRPLSPETLSKRSLPLKPLHVMLQGSRLKLIPLSAERDAFELYLLTNGLPISNCHYSFPAYDADELIWKHMFQGPFSSLQEFRQYLNEREEISNGLIFTVIEIESNLAVGFLGFINNDPENLRIEIGTVVFSPIVQRKGLCTEATYLLVNHAFNLGYRRVDWRTSVINFRSQNFAKKFGFKFEFSLINFVVEKNRPCHVQQSRIIRDEWNLIKKSLLSFPLLKSL